MRVSIVPTDSGYTAGQRFLVFLDGHLVRDAVAADEEEGAVVAYARDEAGALLRADGHFVLETRYGSVVVEVGH